MQKLINISDTWYKRLQPTIESQEFLKLGQFIAEERKSVTVYPKKEEVFIAFNETPFEEVRVVLLGMDPYPNEYKGEPVACGLAFAPRDHEYLPPSLRIIYNTLKETLYSERLTFDSDLNMQEWAKQGVLLLNTALTVRKGKPGSHIPNWDFFTKAVINTLNETTGLIFLLWGNDAKKFRPLINETNHYILECAHPASSIYKKGPWECNHFTRVNEVLKINHNEEIKWLSNLD